MNMWPTMVGYSLASRTSQLIAYLTGGVFSQYLHAQAMMVGLCFANGLMPISDKYGWFYGLLAAFLHYYMVTTVPNLHGGFCLYNGGFTCGVICILMVPELERFCKTREERKSLKS